MWELFLKNARSILTQPSPFSLALGYIIKIHIDFLEGHDFVLPTSSLTSKLL